MDPALQRAAEALVEKGLPDIEKRPGFRHPRARQDSRRSRKGRGRSTCRARSSRWIRRPATCARWSAAATSPRAASTARSRRSGSRARRSSRSSLRRRSKRATRPASVITHLNDPIDTPQGDWLPEDEHSTAGSMTLRTALRTSSNRAAVQLLNTVGIPKAVGYAEKLNVGTPPSVPSLALGASDVTLISLTAAYGAFANGGIVRQPVLIRRVEDSDGNVLYADQAKAASRGQRGDRVPDVEHARRRHQLRHRRTARGRPASRCRRRARPARPTTTSTPGSSASRRTSSPASGSASISRRRSSRTATPASSRCRCGRSFMKTATKGRQARLVHAPLERRRRQRLPHLGQAAERGLRPTSRCEPRRGDRDAVDDLHRVLRAGARSRRRSVRCTRRRRSWIGWPGVFGKDGAPECRSPRIRSDCRPSARGTTGAVARPSPAPPSARSEDPKAEPTAEEPKKKRGFWAPALRRRATRKPRSRPEDREEGREKALAASCARSAGHDRT